MKHSGAGPVCFPARVALFLLFSVGIAISAAAAETPGITDNSILIGSCSALDGPVSFLGRQTVLGASAYLHMINDEGGVYGRKIQLQAFDDSYDPDKAPACFKRMTKEGVFALGFFVGTPTAKVYVPLAQEDKIPVVGLFTGAQLLYEPLKHEVINVRASYYDETREQVDKLWEQNIRKIGVIYQDDPFGKTVLDGVKLALQKHNAAPVATGSLRPWQRGNRIGTPRGDGGTSSGRRDRGTVRCGSGNCEAGSRGRLAAAVPDRVVRRNREIHQRSGSRTRTARLSRK